MSDRTPIKSPHKRLAKLETALRVISTWADFDLKNKPTIPRALVPADVIRLCEKSLKED